MYALAAPRAGKWNVGRFADAAAPPNFRTASLAWARVTSLSVVPSGSVMGCSRLPSGRSCHACVSRLAAASVRSGILR